MSAVHVCGFYDGEHPRLSSASITACPDDERPYDAYLRIGSNIEFFGGQLEDVRYTFPLGERRMDATRIDFVAAAHGAAGRMWHLVSAAPADEWRAKP